MERKSTHKSKQLLVMVLLLGSLGACSWVDVKPEAEVVQVITTEYAENCIKLGIAKAKTLDKIWLFNRNVEKMNQELATLARNEAQTMGGNAIRPVGKLTQGQQAFLVYNCN